MGVRIEGIGTNALLIEGRPRDWAAPDFEIGPDYIEVGSLVTLAAVTGGELRIPNARPLDHRATRIAFGRLGIDFEVRGDGQRPVRARRPGAVRARGPSGRDPQDRGRAVAGDSPPT